jgi:hypothetical protein
MGMYSGLKVSSTLEWSEGGCQDALRMSRCVQCRAKELWVISDDYVNEI